MADKSTTSRSASARSQRRLGLNAATTLESNRQLDRTVIEDVLGIAHAQFLLEANSSRPKAMSTCAACLCTSGTLVLQNVRSLETQFGTCLDVNVARADDVDVLTPYFDGAVLLEAKGCVA